MKHDCKLKSLKNWSKNGKMDEKKLKIGKNEKLKNKLKTVQN